MTSKILVTLLLFGVAQVWASSGSDDGGEDEGLGIVGGNRVRRGDVPYMITFRRVIRFRNGRQLKKHLCGGVLVEANKILTTASCCNSFRNRAVEASAGKVLIVRNERDEQSRNISTVEKSTMFNRSTKDYDACSVTVDEAFDLTPSTVGTISVCSARPAAGTECTISGWGSTFRFFPFYSAVLRRANVKVLSNEECSERLNPRFYPAVTDRMICVAGTRRQSGCIGDGGGPVVCGGEGEECLAGVMSWGPYPCGRRNSATVNADVTNQELMGSLAEEEEEEEEE